MPRHVQSVPAPLSAARAFAFVDRFENAARWDPRVLQADRRTEGPTRVGTRFDLVTRLFGREWQVPYEVVRHEAPDRLVLEGRKLVVGYRDELTVRPVPGDLDGAASVVTYDARLWLRGPLRLVQWLLFPLFHLLFRRVGRDAVEGLHRALAAEARRRNEPVGLPPGTLVSDGPPTPEEVRAIVALGDRPELRNLLITDAYHRLSRALSERLGGDDVNWCGYATWASRTAGAFIRQEELDRETRRLLERKAAFRRRLQAVYRKLAEVVPGGFPADGDGFSDDPLGPVLRSTREVARFVAGGNRIVFAELGELFAAFLRDVADDPTPERLEAFLERLAPGAPEPDDIEVAPDGRLLERPKGGQDLLRDAFRAYAEALGESDPRRRSELVLWGNALSGLHEQVRLQSWIAGGLEAPVGEVFLRRERRRWRESLASPAREAVEALSERLLTPLGDEIEDHVRQATTLLMMTMRVPGEVLALGTDLPAPLGSPLYPPHLERLERQELVEVLTEHGAYGPGDDARGLSGCLLRGWLGLRARLAALKAGRAVALGSAARDWGDLAERMRYIFHYFRSRQASRRLFEAPFDPEQTAAIRSGRIPRGPL